MAFVGPTTYRCGAPESLGAGAARAAKAKVSVTVDRALLRDADRLAGQMTRS